MSARDLEVALIVIENLPEAPGYNGSILRIDEAEVIKIAAAIKCGIAALSDRESLYAIVEKLAKLRNGLANSNSNAEERAAELADDAHKLIFKMTGASL